MELDKACWRCCCPDGRKVACGHDGLDSLTVCLRSLLAPAQFIATKQGEAAQAGPAEMTSDIMVYAGFRDTGHSRPFSSGPQLPQARQFIGQSEAFRIPMRLGGSLQVTRRKM